MDKQPDPRSRPAAKRPAGPRTARPRPAAGHKAPRAGGFEIEFVSEIPE